MFDIYFSIESDYSDVNMDRTIIKDKIPQEDVIDQLNGFIKRIDAIMTNEVVNNFSIRVTPATLDKEPEDG